jgi:hypothetical protein
MSIGSSVEAKISLEDPVISSNPLNFLERMKQGVPLIRRNDFGNKDGSEMMMCMAFLSEDLYRIRFVKQDTHTKGEISVSYLRLSDVDRIAQSNADKHAVALLVPSENMVMELIFAGAEDWSVWYNGLKRLMRPSSTCTENHKIQLHEKASSGKVCELLNEIQEQNRNLKEVVSTHQSMILDMSTLLKRRESEIAQMKRLLELRDGTISELSNLLRSFISKQSSIEDFLVYNPSISFSNSTSDSSAVEVSKCSRVQTDDYFLKNSDRVGTPPTSVSTSFDSTAVIEGLENQLRMLDERKRHLQALFETIGGC